MSNEIKGGKVIASGGYGCIFKPALRCQGTKKRLKGKISKLMTENHTLKEYKEIEKIKSKIRKIPNYEEYFLINDITICKPEKLTKSDLNNYKTQCRALPKDDIYENNINSSIDNLLLLNMPDGGLAIDDFNSANGSFKKWFHTSNGLIKLLENAIIPLNKQNFFHSDIKDSNILIEEIDDHYKLRLIDWGLATEYVPFINSKIPTSWYNRSLAFNVPFSIILFNDHFEKLYIKYITKFGKINEDILNPFVLKYIKYWFKTKGPGNYKIINQIMYILFSNDIDEDDKDVKIKIIEEEFTIFYITNYLVQIIKKYTYFKNNKLVINLRNYLDNVFIHIIDIWGLLLSYISLLESLFTNYKKLSYNQHKIFEYIKHLYITYLYLPRTEKINTKKLIFDMQKLNLLIKNETQEKDILKTIDENKGQFTKKYYPANKKTRKARKTKNKFKN
jgi:hypothetical protein